MSSTTPFKYNNVITQTLSSKTDKYQDTISIQIPEGHALTGDLMSLIDDYVGKPTESYNPTKEYMNILSKTFSFTETNWDMYYGPIYTEYTCNITYTKWGGGKIMVDHWFKKEHNHGGTLKYFLEKTI
jgi:hypothetical protein